jgi:hypothetical protein
MKSVKWLALSLLGFATMIFLAGCGGGGAVQQPVVTMGATPATVQPGTTAQFSATISNDSSHKGINWSVTCAAADCGSLSLANTASGAPTTYKAPTTPPAGDLMVTITASAAAGGATAASANFKVPGITVTVAAPSVTPLKVNATAQVTATVTGDSAANAVTWTVSCSITDCGSVSPATTASGVATTYKAPASPPAGNLTVTITAASVTNSAATGSTTETITGITISVAPASVTVKSAGKQSFTATVNDDPTGGGVIWHMQIVRRICNPFTHQCSISTTTCSTTCGTLSPATTASSVATTYTAPVRPPSNSPLSQVLAVDAVAVSATNALAEGTAKISIQGISVSVAPDTSASVVVNTTLAFTATVTNDGANGGAGAGVTWTLTQNGVACSPGCGAISPASTASGATASYTAPAAVPALPLLTVTATSVTDPNKLAFVTITVTTASGAACGAGSGSESLLKGQYAYRLQTTSSYGIAGSFTADGTGKVTAGEEDDTSLSGFQVDATRSSYAVGQDHRGCLTLGFTNGATTYFRFALGGINSSSIATTGHIIEFDDTTGTGSSTNLPILGRIAGTLKMQDATSFLANQFKGNYVVEFVGVAGGSRFAAAGTFASDGVSVITSSNFDIDVAGTLTSNLASAPGGAFTCCSANGRGTLQFTGSNFTSNLVLYMVNSSDVFLVGLGDGPNSGEAIGVPAGTTFTQESLNGASVIRKSAQSTTGPVVDVALASANGTGSMNVSDNTNNAGTFSTSNTAFTYTVGSNGRVAMIGGTNPPVLYLYGNNTGFLVGTDANVEFGAIEAQAAGPFDNASLSGAYTLGTEDPSTDTVALQSGVATLNGSGNAAGTSDQSSSTGLAQNQNLKIIYSVVGSGEGTFGSGTTAILVSGNRIVFISNTSATPTITVVEK